MRKSIRRKEYDTATAPSQGWLRRTVVSWVGLFLLIFNLAAGGTLPAQAAGSLSSDDHLIVCTVGGMAVVDRNGTPVPPDHAGENGFCSACLPFCHGAVLTPAAALLPQPIVQPVPRAPIADAEPVNVPRPLRLGFPRAPPQA